jgi:ferredoxin--NADP+ reductase
MGRAKAMALREMRYRFPSGNHLASVLMNLRLVEIARVGCEILNSRSACTAAVRIGQSSIYSVSNPDCRGKYINRIGGIFFSIKVPDGPLTSRLQHLKIGDTLFIGRKPTGRLIVDNLLPGRVLWLLSTGTGLAPFMSVIRDPAVYERYDRIVVTHTCRHIRELAYRDYITQSLPDHEFLGESVREKLIYYPTVTREPFSNTGRITDLIENGKLFSEIGLPSFSIEHDRIMLCGSSAMLRDTRALLDARGFEEGNQSIPGHYVVQRAFVS